MKSAPVAVARIAFGEESLSRTSTTLRFALIGCGELGLHVHLPNLLRMKGVDLVALVDPREERLAAAAERSGGASPFTSTDELLASERVDAAIVATPPHTHSEIAIRLVKAGVAVYLEKPLAADVEEAEAVYRAWSEAPVPFMMGLNFRYHRLALRMKTLASAGRTGGVRHVRTLFSIPAAKVVSSEWRGGQGVDVLVELGSHHFDLVSFLTDRPVESVHTVGLWSSGQDQTAVCVLHLEGGIPAECCLAFGLTLEDQWEMRGPGGVLEVDRLRGSGVRFARPEPGPSDVLKALTEVVSVPGRLWAWGRRLTIPWGERSFPAALEAFADAVRRDGRPRPGIVEGLQLMRTLDAARRSLRSGRAEPLIR